MVSTGPRRARQLTRDDLVATGPLRLEECAVGSIEDLVDRLGWCQGVRHADGHAGARDAVDAEVELADGRSDTLPHLERDGGPGVPEQDRELLAADSRGNIVVANSTSDRRGDSLEHLVAD